MKPYLRLNHSFQSFHVLPMYICTSKVKNNRSLIPKNDLLKF